MSDKTFLNNAYGLEGAEETREFYNAWSKSYDAEIAANGYATPRRCSEALAQFVADKTAAHLDIGCGTGVSGLALVEAGFSDIHGTDLSPQMVEQAKEKAIYQSLTIGDLNNPFPFETGTYASMSAIGVLSPGHAPAETLREILQKLATGGHFTFSLNDHALEDSDYMSVIHAIQKEGLSETVFEEYGTHLPKIDLKSTVYVLRRR